MANVFITPSEIIDRIFNDAKSIVAEMPIDSVLALSKDKPGGIGIQAGLHAALVIAAQERIDGVKERQCPE